MLAPDNYFGSGTFGMYRCNESLETQHTESKKIGNVQGMYNFLFFLMATSIAVAK